MAQIPLYLPEPVARELARKAEARGVSVSRLLAELVRREVPAGWPEDFFERDAADSDGLAGGVPADSELRDDV